MLIKSFYGPTMNAAMQKAAKEFGDDALILNSRETPLEMRTQGRFEVVATIAALPMSSSAVAEGAEPREANPIPPGDALNAVNSTAWPTLARNSNPSHEQEVHHFVGLPGSGKTTCALKMAIVQGIWKGRRVGFLHFDTQRIARQQSVEWYCQAAGIPLWNSREEMEVSDWETLDLIVVDCSGVPSHTTAQELLPASKNMKRRKICSHLVAPAWAGPTYFDACRNLAQAGEARYLLPSFLDTGFLHEDAAAAAARADLGVRFLSAGGKVPSGFYESGDKGLAQLADHCNLDNPMRVRELASNCQDNGQKIAKILAGNRIPRRGNFRTMTASAE